MQNCLNKGELLNFLLHIWIQKTNICVTKTAERLVPPLYKLCLETDASQRDPINCCLLTSFPEDRMDRKLLWRWKWWGEVEQHLCGKWRTWGDREKEPSLCVRREGRVAEEAFLCCVV